MENGASAHVVANGGVTLLDELVRKRIEALSPGAARESPELSESKVAREGGHNVEKPGLRLRIAELLDAADVRHGKVHRDRISAVNSR